MTNRAFLLKSRSDKQKKLTVLLRKRTRDALSQRQLDAIIGRLRLDKQYSVQVHTTPCSFRHALVLVHTNRRKDFGEVIFGQASFGISHMDSSESGQFLSVHDIAAAQIVQNVGSPAEHHALHIYIPQKLYLSRKEVQHEKR